MKRKIKILVMFIFMLMLVFPDVCFAEEKLQIINHNLMNMIYRRLICSMTIPQVF